MIDLAQQVEPPVSVARACEALGLSRATLYRRTTTAPPLPAFPLSERRVARKLAAEERQAIVDVLHSAEFADQPPREVYGALLSRGVYLASIRTMYRILQALGESQERRAQRTHPRPVKPVLEATAPNQVWTWDITKLAGPERGIFYCLYVIIDLFSRYVVGWLLAEKENAALAERLFAETLARHGIEPGQLVVHADRGGPMRSQNLAQLLAQLGVTRSFSRPRVSNDNAFSEAGFKTFKYQPDFPDHFESLLHGRAYCQTFFGWHNDDHHHEGLALFTPADVFHGRIAEVAARRQAALDAAFVVHPERFPNGAPRVALPPTKVSINPLQVSNATALPENDSHAAPQDPPANNNVDERHGARHGLMSCPDPITVTSNPTPPPTPGPAPAHQPAAELDSENPT